MIARTEPMKVRRKEAPASPPTAERPQPTPEQQANHEQTRALRTWDRVQSALQAELIRRGHAEDDLTAVEHHRQLGILDALAVKEVKQLGDPGENTTVQLDLADPNGGESLEAFGKPQNGEYAVDVDVRTGEAWKVKSVYGEDARIQQSREGFEETADLSTAEQASYWVDKKEALQETRSRVASAYGVRPEAVPMGTDRIGA